MYLQSLLSFQCNGQSIHTDLQSQSLWSSQCKCQAGRKKLQTLQSWSKLLLLSHQILHASLDVPKIRRRFMSLFDRSHN